MTTHTDLVLPTATSTTSWGARLVGLIGLAIPVISFSGLHQLSPAGRPEQMSDAEVAAWAASGATSIWVGGVMQLVAALLLVVLAAEFDSRLRRWGASPVPRRVSEASLVLVAGLAALCGILQVSAGVLGTPAEAYESATLLPIVALLYGNINVAVWCLIVPAAAATAWTPRAPGWLRVLSAILTVALVLSLALPFVSWAPAFAWLTAVAVAMILGR